MDDCDDSIGDELFVVAGISKLADRRGSRQAIIDFGVPTALAAPLGVLLPLVELAVAASLVPAATAYESGGQAKRTTHWETLPKTSGLRD